MRRKYGIFIVIFLILLAGFIVTLLNRFYSFDYLYNSIIRRDFAVNPRVEMKTDRIYEVRIWYYPFYRTVIDREEEEFFHLLQQKLEETYPNIRIVIGKIDFLTGEEKLREAIKAGNPPDIYMNLTEQNLINEDLQIPVSPFISDEEKNGFYTVNWDKISHRDKLWGWPLAVSKQYWIACDELQLNRYQYLDFIRKINHLEKESLYLNYYDQTSLLQFLTMVGLDTFKLEQTKLDLDSYLALEEVFILLDRLRKNEIVAENLKEMPDIFLKKLLEGKKVIVGPVNPYLYNFLEKREKKNYSSIQVDDLVKTYKINIFRQRKYKGDDHSRAVMEVARIISEELAPALCEELNMSTSYISGLVSEKVDCRELLEINPEYLEYWNKRVVPAWIAFWEENLVPEEVMRRIDYGA